MTIHTNWNKSSKQIIFHWCFFQGTYEGKAVLLGKSDPEKALGCVAFAVKLEAKQVTEGSSSFFPNDALEN